MILYPQKGSLVAQVVLGRDQNGKALTMKFCKNVDKLLRETPQLHDGKWLFIPVKSSAEVNDIQKLLLSKQQLVKKRQA